MFTCVAHREHHGRLHNRSVISVSEISHERDIFANISVTLLHVGVNVVKKAFPYQLFSFQQPGLIILPVNIFIADFCGKSAGEFQHTDKGIRVKTTGHVFPVDIFLRCKIHYHSEDLFAADESNYCIISDISLLHHLFQVGYFHTFCICEVFSFTDHTDQIEFRNHEIHFSVDPMQIQYICKVFIL